MHHVLESSIGEKCTCGNPASHKVEEVLDFGSFSSIEDAVNAGVRHPLTVYLCCQCFSKLMGDPFDWCGLTQAAPDVATPRRRMVVCPNCETMFGVELSPTAPQVS